MEPAARVTVFPLSVAVQVLGLTARMALGASVNWICALSMLSNAMSGVGFEHTVWLATTPQSVSVTVKPPGWPRMAEPGDTLAS